MSISLYSDTPADAPFFLKRELCATIQVRDLTIINLKDRRTLQSTCE